MIYLEGRVEDLERQLLDQSSTEFAQGANGGGGDKYKDQLIAQLQRENYEMRMREVQHASNFVRCIGIFSSHPADFPSHCFLISPEPRFPTRPTVFLVISSTLTPNLSRSPLSRPTILVSPTIPVPLKPLNLIHLRQCLPYLPLLVLLPAVV